MPYVQRSCERDAKTKSSSGPRQNVPRRDGGAVEGSASKAFSSHRAMKHSPASVDVPLIKSLAEPQYVMPMARATCENTSEFKRTFS